MFGVYHSDPAFQGEVLSFPVEYDPGVPIGSLVAITARDISSYTSWLRPDTQASEASSSVDQLLFYFGKSSLYVKTGVVVSGLIAPPSTGGYSSPEQVLDIVTYNDGVRYHDIGIGGYYSQLAHQGAFYCITFEYGVDPRVPGTTWVAGPFNWVLFRSTSESPAIVHKQNLVLGPSPIIYVLNEVLVICSLWSGIVGSYHDSAFCLKVSSDLGVTWDSVVLPTVYGDHVLTGIGTVTITPQNLSIYSTDKTERGLLEYQDGKYIVYGYANVALYPTYANYFALVEWSSSDLVTWSVRVTTVTINDHMAYQLRVLIDGTWMILPEHKYKKYDIDAWKSSDLPSRLSFHPPIFSHGRMNDGYVLVEIPLDLVNGRYERSRLVFWKTKDGISWDKCGTRRVSSTDMKPSFVNVYHKYVVYTDGTRVYLSEDCIYWHDLGVSVNVPTTTFSRVASLMVSGDNLVIFLNKSNRKLDGTPLTDEELTISGFSVIVKDLTKYWGSREASVFIEGNEIIPHYMRVV